MAQNRSMFRDAASHESLLGQAKKVRETRIDPVTLLRQAEGEDPSVVNRPGDLIARSDVLCFNGFATLVPKRAVLHIPDYYRSRIGIQEGARIVPWREFMIRNRGWVSTHEVDRPTAEGRTPFDEDTTERFSKSSRLIVATLRGGPISVLPPKEPEPAGEGEGESAEGGVVDATGGETSTIASQ